MTDPAIYVAGSETYFIARIPAVLGCNASGKTRDEAIANVRHAFKEYIEMLAARGVSTDRWKSIDPDALPVRESPADSVFPGEDQPLEEHEIRDFLHQYEASRATVMALLSRLSSEQIETPPDEKTWSVRQALEHMLQTDITLLSRLEKWPADPVQRLSGRAPVGVPTFQRDGAGRLGRPQGRTEPLHDEKGHATIARARVRALRTHKRDHCRTRYEYVVRPLRYSINVTLDGCCDHREAFADEDLHRHAVENLERADALLFGRVTYEMMEAAFRPPPGTAPDSLEPFARTIDAAKKYVVSSTLDRVDWNAELVRGDLGQAVQQLKRESGKGLFVGGVKLPLALAELGLIDEYEFVVHPRVAGHGPTLFAGLSKPLDLKLVSRLELGSGAVAMRYEPRGSPSGLS